MKFRNPFILISIIIIIIIIVMEAGSPANQDWSGQFNINDTRPYDLTIFEDELSKYFKQDITYNDSSFYLSLKNSKDTNSILFMINDGLETYDDEYNILPDIYSVIELKEWISKGNTAFISTIFPYSYNSFDTLGVYINSMNFYSYDETEINFYNKNLSNVSNFKYENGKFNAYFNNLDSLDPVVLGFVEDRTKRPNFIKTKIGKGNLYISTFPYAYTNYNLLYNNTDFPFRSLSYLPRNPDKVIFDRYYKLERFLGGDYAYKYSRSPFRYIANRDSLRWGWYTLLLFAIIFLIFGAKRYVRAIPEYKEPENSSLSFVNTITGLYLKSTSRKEILNKKLSNFKSWITNVLKLSPDREDFRKELILKTGIDNEKAKFIEFYLKAFDKEEITDSELIKICKNIDEIMYRS